MRTLFSYPLVLLFTILVFSCQKEKEITVTTHVYEGDDVNTRSLFLYVDGSYKGLLPNHNVPVIACGQQGLDTLSLTFTLKSGEHNFIIKDSLGKQLHSSFCRIRESGIGGSCYQGRQAVTKSEDCLLVELSTDSISIW